MSTQILTHKILLKPNDIQKEILWQLSEKNRLMYNFALSERKKQFEKNKDLPKDEKEYLSFYDQVKWKTEQLNNFPEYRICQSRVYEMTLKKLDADYKSFFALWRNGDNDARPPRYKGKGHFTTLIYNQSGWYFDLQHQKIGFQKQSKFDLEMKFVYLTKSSKPRRLQDDDKIKQIEIFYNKKENKFYASINFERKVPEYVDNSKYQAFDPGNISLGYGVNIDGKFIDVTFRRFDKYWRKKIDEVKAKRDNCLTYWKHPNSDKIVRSHDNNGMSKKGYYPVKRSRKWHYYNKKAKKMSKKQQNQFRDFYHFISKKLIQNTRANTIIWGGKENKKLAQKKKGTGSFVKNKINSSLNYASQNLGQSKFIEFLTYKAVLEGKRLIKIDERGTTKTCYICKKKKKRSLDERIVNCDCGNNMKRDANSACNIMERYLLSQEPPLSGVADQFRKAILRQTGLSQDNHS